MTWTQILIAVALFAIPFGVVILIILLPLIIDEIGDR